MGAVLYKASDQHQLLAARPPSRLQRRLAYGVIAGFLALFCITVPYAQVQLPIVTAFVPIQASVIVVNDLITAALLAAQFWVVRWTWLLVLASGYFFTALIFVSFVLTFPGVFAPTGLMGPGLQTASWISTCLHMGVPVFLITAMLVRHSRQPASLCERAPGLAIALGFALAAAIVCGVTWASVAYDKILPQLFLNSFQQSHSVAPRVVPIIAANVVAILLLWRRGRSVLDLWLMVMCWTWLFEVTVGGLFAGSRYSIGWYTGRMVQVTATYFVLLLLLSETTTLYANMVRSAMLRRGGRRSRQIAMDAMAASIGHEIKQPLSAVLTNAEACALQLGKSEPDLKEVLATVTDIAADARRINGIIGSVRTMFRDSTHDRQLLNLNAVVRDALSTVELDLHLQRVMVKTELDNKLSPVLADGGQLHQVFLNLITNATEAMTGVTQRPCVLTVTSSIVAGTSNIAVTVEDTGVGIAAKNSDQIFEPFFSTKVAGSGVGLVKCGQRNYLATNAFHTRIHCSLANSVRQQAEGDRHMPKFVTIGYGDQEGYDRTPVAIRDAAHAHDAKLKEDGVLMGIARTPVQVRNPNAAQVETTNGPFMTSALPVAGFAIVEAANIAEAIDLVSRTPCAVAHGVVEVWPLEKS